MNNLSLVQIPVAEPRERRLQAVAHRRRRWLKQSLMGLIFLIFLTVGWIFPPIGYFIPVCMVLGLGIAFWRGRYWCDWLCPRGSFNDAWLSRISRQRQLPEWLRATPTRVVVLGVLLTVMTVQLVRLWPDWWAIGGFFVLLLTVTTVAADGQVAVRAGLPTASLVSDLPHRDFVQLAGTPSPAPAAAGG